MLEIFKHVVYGKGLPENQAKYGTEPAESIWLSNSIYNVTDLEKALRNLILSSPNGLSEKVGDLHIYKDGSPMRFE